MTQQHILPLTTVLENYASPHTNQTWEEWLQTQDPEILDHAQRLIKDKGNNPYFDEPITLIEDETDEDGDFYLAHVANGMHRILATHLTGQKDIYVQYGFSPEENPAEELSIVLHFSRTETKSEQALLDAEDMLWERLSFRHHGTKAQPWVEPFLGSYVNKVARIYLYCDNPREIELEELFQQVTHITETVPYYKLIGVALEDWSLDDVKRIGSFGNAPED